MTTIARYNWTDSDGEHKNDIRWDADTGGLAMCGGKEAYAQTIEAVVLTVRGELITRRNYGVPYFSTVFDRRAFTEKWANAVQEIVSGLSFVSSIDSFEYEYDEKRKVMTYSMSVTTSDGSQVVAENL